MGPNVRHFIRMGTHAERDYLLKHRRFDELIVNANLVEASRSALAYFVVVLGKPYRVDPVTYAFALDPGLLLAAPSKGKPGRRLRSTFDALATKMAIPLGAALATRRLDPGDFGAADKIEALAAASIEYQRSQLPDALSENADFLVGDEAAAQVASPRRYVAP